MIRSVVGHVQASYRWGLGRLHPQAASSAKMAHHRELSRFSAFVSQPGNEPGRDVSALRPSEIQQQWEHITRTGFDPRTPDSFYRSWVGATGFLNVRTNIDDQFSRVEFFTALQQHLPNHNGIFMDYGCGTAAMDWEWLGQFSSAWLVDFPNTAQDYVNFKIRREGWPHVRTLHPADTRALSDGSVDVLVCIDVLEHLDAPSELFSGQLHRLLRPGGLLFLQTPWGGGVPEHLPEAEPDWVQRGGQQCLRRKYRKVQRINPLIELKPNCISGVFEKC
jgi:SAM-dependent methyltransferase